MVGFGNYRFGVAAVQQYCHAASTAAGFDIAPSIADHVAARRVQSTLGSRSQEQPGQRLAARTSVTVIMWANTKVQETELRPEMAVDSLDRLERNRASGNVRLIGDHDKLETEALQLVEGFAYARQDLDLINCRRRPRYAVGSDQAPIEYAVTVKEDRGRTQRIDSHFMAFACTRGWDTRRCHTSAWKLSVWGVTLAGFTVGTMTTTSASFAVYPPSRPTTPQTVAPSSRAC